MKIVEITDNARKQIKLLQDLYISYLLDKSGYQELSDMIHDLKKSDDLDTVREAEIINQKLMKEIIRILSK
jgi:hypothetical protein